MSSLTTLEIDSNLVDSQGQVGVGRSLSWVTESVGPIGPSATRCESPAVRSTDKRPAPALGRVPSTPQTSRTSTATGWSWRRVTSLAPATTNAGIGDAVGIHGSDNPSLNRRKVDWTWGYISLENADVAELVTLVPIGTLMLIGRLAGCGFRGVLRNPIRAPRLPCRPQLACTVIRRARARSAFGRCSASTPPLIWALMPSRSIASPSVKRRQKPPTPYSTWRGFSPS
jgi:hypothetical protein